jgi:hypothetical protein
MVSRIENRNVLTVSVPAGGGSVAGGKPDPHLEQAHEHEEDVIVLKRIHEPLPDWTGEKGRFIDIYV